MIKLSDAVVLLFCTAMGIIHGYSGDIYIAELYIVILLLYGSCVATTDCLVEAMVLLSGIAEDIDLDNQVLEVNE